MDNKIRKTGKKNTYFKGSFFLRDNTNINWAHPINFPTVFIAYTRGIKSGNWESCTAINTPDFVIKNYFNNEEIPSKYFWGLVEELEAITWDEVGKNKEKVLAIINNANNELSKLPEIV